MRYFFVGIKGVGMTSLATLYKQWGYEVAGSDVEERFFTDAILERLGIPVTTFDLHAITSGIDRVIYTTAHNTNLQLERARSLGIPMQTYAEALAELFNQKKGIVVTGTHGKTTSTAMLGRVLEDAGWDPTVVVGGEILEWEATARGGKSEWMVAEGDEYQAKILELRPHAVLPTNMEYDHPDFYATEEAYRQVFRDMLLRLDESKTVVAHLSLRDFVEQNCVAKKIYFDASTLPRECQLTVWGEHNRANAAGVLVLARALGIPEQVISKTLSQFRGTRRRMELYTPQDASCVLIDDYAHHPTEVRSTLAALRARYPKRKIIALFQPHTYSRTKALLGDFAAAFGDSDTAIILDIYASAREQEKTISGEELYEQVKAHHQDVLFACNIDEVFVKTKKLLGLPAGEDCVVVTMGAGDVWKVLERLAKEGGS